MNQRERQAYLLSQGDDSAHMSEDGPDHAEVRALMSQGKRGTGGRGPDGISGIDPVSVGLSAIASIFGHKPLHPDIAPNQPPSWHTTAATGYPYQSYTDKNGTTHILAAGRDFNLDNSQDAASWNVLKMTVPPASVLASAPAGGGLTTTSYGSLTGGSGTSGLSTLSLSNPLVIGALVVGGFLLMKSLKSRRPGRSGPG